MEEYVYFSEGISKRKLRKKGYRFMEVGDSLFILDENKKPLVSLVYCSKCDEIAVFARGKVEVTNQVEINLVGDNKETLALDVRKAFFKKRICIVA